MTLEEQANVTKALGTLAVILGEDISDDRLEAYLVVLDDLSGAAVERACGKLAQSARFFPKPAEIRELIEDSATERAERAWILLVEACQKSGDCSVFFESNALAQTMLNMFGSWITAYESIVHLSPEMLAAKRKEFLTVYRMVEKRLPDADVRFQPGRHELNNRETLANWKHRYLEMGKTEFDQQVVVVRDRVTITATVYDLQNGQISGGSWKQLIEGTEPKQLPARPAPKMIEAATGEPMSREEFQQGIREFTRRGMHIVGND